MFFYTGMVKMKKFAFIKIMMVIVSTITMMTLSYAGTPLWTFTPLTPTSISVPGNGTATVSYQVTNQSPLPHTLVMTPIRGVTQIVAGVGLCGNPFTLSTQGASCTLMLQINGSQIINGFTNGPQVCQRGSSLQCYRPSVDDILNINVLPVPSEEFTVGGTVSGLSGTVSLTNNNSDLLTISSNGSFTFATPLANGATYNVTVQSQPSGQTCIVANGTGTINGSNVTNVTVTCTSNTTTLSTSLANLALAISGQARTITVTNTGSSTALNLSISFPTWPTGTTAGSNCGSTLNSGDTCIITVTPGANATSNCNAGTGSAPTPGVITVSASNVASSVSTNVVVLTFGCIYQQGYLFDINDTTPPSTSIGGTTVELTDNPGSPQKWYNAALVTTNAQSLTDGASNTATIIAVQGAGSYAAELCSNYTIDSSGNSPCLTGTCYSNWYLPAICQMGSVGEGAGCASGLPNMVTNLPALVANTCSGSACLFGQYWSSTEYSLNSSDDAYLETFSLGSGSQAAVSKTVFRTIRCTRAIT